MDVDIKPRHIAICTHQRNGITCLQFDMEKILAGSGEDTYIDVYDIKTGALRKRLERHEGGVWALEFHGKTLVSCSTDHSVRVWDIEKGVCTQVFKGHTSTVRCLKILMPVRVGMMPDGQAEMVPKVPLIITGSRGSTLRVWKLPLSGDKPFTTGSSQNELECPYFIRTLQGHHDSVRAIATYQDTLVSGSYDCSVRVWEISTGETKRCLQGRTQKVYSVVLDYKRNRCISGSWGLQQRLTKIAMPRKQFLLVVCSQQSAELLAIVSYRDLHLESEPALSCMRSSASIHASNASTTTNLA
jgi:F-box and WD-40 domain protein CDC4